MPSSSTPLRQQQPDAPNENDAMDLFPGWTREQLDKEMAAAEAEADRGDLVDGEAFMKGVIDRAKARVLAGP